MAATAFNSGGGKLHTTLNEMTINGGSAVVVSLPKCSVCVISYSTTWSDQWSRWGFGVISGSATGKGHVMANYNGINHNTYVYTDVTESTKIDFGICPLRVNVHVACIQ